MDENPNEGIFDVVINDEEQYSIWSVELDMPAGWHTVDVRGTQAECLKYIEVHWVDMRPRSLRERHEAMG